MRLPIVSRRPLILLPEIIMSDQKAPRVSVKDCESDDAPAATAAAQEEDDEIGSWMLYEYDEQTTEANTAHEEFRRLQVLRSYCALDIQDGSIDRLTRTACLTFGVSGAWVCLVDFRRIVYFSKHGIVEGLDILPRLDRYACAHAIQYRGDRVYVVPDMSQNSLFQNMEFVSHPPHMNFYAAAPLISPEGFRIGIFGLVDQAQRPQGFTEDEKDALVDYAALAVKILADHRFKVSIREKMTKAIAITSHHLVTPLSGLQLSLSLLKEDGQGTESNFSEQQKEMIATAETCSSAMSRITRTAFADLRTEMTARTSTSTGTVAICSRPSSPSRVLPDCSVRVLIDRINEVRYYDCSSFMELVVF